MPFIRSLVFKYYTLLTTIIVLLNEIMPTDLYYTKKKLVYIIIRDKR